jgi:hypothetical protein
VIGSTGWTVGTNYERCKAPNPIREALTYPADDATGSSLYNPFMHSLIWTRCEARVPA